MNLHSTTFWEKNPLIAKQIPPRISKFPRDVNYYLYTLLGAPFFHHYVLDTLVDACKKDLSARRGKVAIVDVCFPEKEMTKIQSLFEIEDNQDVDAFLVLFGTWLTQQLAAHLSEEKFSQYPAVYVRCIQVDNIFERKGYSVVKPKDRRGILSKVLAYLVASSIDEKFFLLLPRQSTSKNVKLKIKTPLSFYDEKKFEFDTRRSAFGKKDISPSQQKKSDDVFQLVVDDHVEIAVARGGSDNIDFSWIKHLGIHETWLVQKNNDEEIWQLVAENSWMLVESETSIVLGRVAEVSTEKSIEKIILPGSLVFELEI